MKKNVVFIILVLISINLQSQSFEDRFKTNVQRVNIQGSTPPQTRYNYYADKLLSFLTNNEWTNDAIVSIKEMKVMQLDDPSDWYYFIAAKTKKCSTPFIMSYDIGNSNLGELFIIEPAGYPVEFQNYVNKRIEAQKQSASDLEVAREIYGEEALKVFNEQVLPILVSYIKNNYSTRVNAHISKTLDDLLDGYEPKDSTQLSKEDFKKRLFNNLTTNSNVYKYYIVPWIEDSEEMVRYSTDTFIDSYVLDRKNSINNFIAKKKLELNNSIESYYAKSNAWEIEPIKENTWYKIIQFKKKESFK